jgi:hypothetical protein
MGTIAYTRLNDLWPGGTPSRETLDLSVALGDWSNFKPDTGEIRSLSLSEAGGGLILRAFGADDPEPRDWGETPALPHTSGLAAREISGFTARYDFGFMETQIAANIKYGTLVIQSYNAFRDGSGRPAYFNREFFYQDLGAEPSLTRLDGPGEDPGLPCRMAGDDPGDGAGAFPGTGDLSPFLGSWRNTYRDSKGIRRFILARQGDRNLLRVWGVGRDEVWGAVPVVPHAPHVASRQPAGFLARYDFGSSEVTLAVNENKGLLVVAAFTTFRDGSARSSYLTREFFYREGDDFSS